MSTASELTTLRDDLATGKADVQTCGTLHFRYLAHSRDEMWDVADALGLRATGSRAGCRMVVI